eukprot:CAMPEP_0184327760 /NCGR_PEP_ID=MMETSP1049-20130417/143262_1 /TAXON_ID=77928 /ORGANISM="Proteomonas sulcata, Strain CCMP704" /LENGTH=328 /DNA_ID=CAMNT_0026650031 /DNA_START=90 /DNA_END=1076 /DNA_ORIENTATION=-
MSHPSSTSEPSDHESPRSSNPNPNTADAAVQVEHLFDDLDEFTETQTAVDSAVDNEEEDLEDEDCEETDSVDSLSSSTLCPSALGPSALGPSALGPSAADSSTPRVNIQPLNLPLEAERSPQKPASVAPLTPRTPRTQQSAGLLTPRGTGSPVKPIVSPSSGFWKMADATEDRIKSMESLVSDLSVKVEELTGRNLVLRVQNRKLRARGEAGEQEAKELRIKRDKEARGQGAKDPKGQGGRQARAKHLDSSIPEPVGFDFRESKLEASDPAGHLAEERGAEGLILGTEGLRPGPDMDLVAQLDLREWMLTPREGPSTKNSSPKCLHVF